MSLDAETNALLQKVLLGVLALFALGNITVLGLWVIGRSRGKPLLAPVWSAADVFLGLQAVVAIIAAGGCFVSIAAAALVPGPQRANADAFSSAVMAVALVPLMLLQQGALVVVPAAFVKLRYREGLSSLGLTPVNSAFWKQLAWGALLGLALLPLNDLIELLSSFWLLDSGSFPNPKLLRAISEEMSAVRILDQLRNQPQVLAAMVLIVGLVGPIAEEIFFRGFAFTALKRRFGVGVGVTLSALLFAGIHGNPVAVIPIFFIGLILAGIFHRTGSLAASFGLHCANNLAVVAVYFLAPDFSFWRGVFK